MSTQPPGGCIKQKEDLLCLVLWETEGCDHPAGVKTTGGGGGVGREIIVYVLYNDKKVKVWFSPKLDYVRLIFMPKKEAKQ